MEKGRRIHQARAEAFQAHAQKIGGSYKTDRSLVGRKEANRETYAGYLPSYEGKNLLDILNRKAQTEDPVTLLDLGCGKGQFLLDLARHAPHLHLTGITSYPYHQESPSHVRNLDQHDIKIHVADIQDLKRVIPSNSVDVATSVFAFGYLADPWWALKQTYDILKPGGIGLFYGFPLADSLKSQKPVLDQVAHYLKEQYGMEITIYGINSTQMSFEKNKPHLTLPLSYSKKKHITMVQGQKNITFPRFTYTLDPRVLQRAA